MKLLMKDKNKLDEYTHTHIYIYIYILNKKGTLSKYFSDLYTRLYSEFVFSLVLGQIFQCCRHSTIFFIYIYIYLSMFTVFVNNVLYCACV